eukprot:TRINITY_DN13594_c0_g1_i1.p1 TRINITY_DN13594_c0_g1~~TRINITY_DN13594_c0_g1_i1.p1  ORF type:complete len:149 (-),score=18.08 TRINITY_DN13594_c0_g1_i1:86-532(-)
MDTSQLLSIPKAKQLISLLETLNITETEKNEVTFALLANKEDFESLFDGIADCNGTNEQTFFVKGFLGGIKSRRTLALKIKEDYEVAEKKLEALENQATFMNKLTPFAVTTCFHSFFQQFCIQTTPNTALFGLTRFAIDAMLWVIFVY